jgi:hypothetical protein
MHYQVQCGGVCYGGLTTTRTTRVAKSDRIARQQGPLMAMKYGDQKAVTFLSTFEGPR